MPGIEGSVPGVPALSSNAGEPAASLFGMAKFRGRPSRRRLVARSPKVWGAVPMDCEGASWPDRPIRHASSISDFAINAGCPKDALRSLRRVPYRPGGRLDRAVDGRGRRSASCPEGAGLPDLGVLKGCGCLPGATGVEAVQDVLRNSPLAVRVAASDRGHRCSTSAGDDRPGMGTCNQAGPLSGARRRAVFARHQRIALSSAIRRPGTACPGSGRIFSSVARPP